MEFKKELFLLKAISEIFEPSEEPTKSKEKQLMAIDPCNVVLITHKSEIGKRIVRRFVDDSNTTKKVPNLNYNTNGDEYIESKYSMDYLIPILKIFSKSESVTMSMKQDYPLTIEDEDFKIILAPRVESE